MRNRKKGIFLLITGIFSLSVFCSRDSIVAPDTGSYSLSGQVTQAGSTVENVRVALSGETTSVTSTDSLGGYLFSGLSGGLYAVTASRQGFCFTPTEIELKLDGASLTGRDFVMAPLAASLLLLEEAIDFGEVSLGGSGEAMLGLSNLGRAKLVITSFTITGGPFSVGEQSLEVPTDSLVYLTVRFTPSATGPATGTLTISSNDPQSPETVISLKGKGAGPGGPQVSAEPAALSFGTVRVGQSSVMRVRLTSSGGDTLHVGSVSVNHQAFSVISTASVLPPGANGEIEVAFTPQDTGQVTAVMTISTNDADSPVVTVSLAGKGATYLEPSIQVTPDSLDFGTVYLDSAISMQLEIRNKGQDSLLVTGFTFSDRSFSSSYSGGDILATGESVLCEIVFQAQTPGERRAILTVYNSDPAQTELEITLTAAAVDIPPTMIRFNPPELSFGEVAIGASREETFWVVNPNSVPLALGGAAVSDEVFLVQAADSMVIQPADSVPVVVRFAPTAEGPLSGVIVFSANMAERDTVSYALSGEGFRAADPALELTPAVLDLGTVVLGDSSLSSIVFKNAGQGPLLISGLEIDNPSFRTAQNAPDRLEPGASFILDVVFRPTVIELAKGTLSVHSNDPGSQAPVVGLVGMGVDTTAFVPLMTLTPRAIDLGPVVLQLTASAIFQVGNIGRDTLMVTKISSTQWEFSAEPKELVVPPGEYRSVTVFCTPYSVGRVSGAMVIFSNDRLRAVDTVSVAAEGTSDSGVNTETEIFIAGGSFLMGCEGEVEPVRLVSVRSFYMDAYEVTNVEYKEFLESGGYDKREYWTEEGWEWRRTSRKQQFDPADPRPMNWSSGPAPWESDRYSSFPNSPVVGINWYEASAYARFRGKSLPTEAQWEYAARGTDGRAYPWGEYWEGAYTNHGKSRSPYYDDTDGFIYTATVGSFPDGTTPEEIFNLAGNVWEWCADWYDYYDLNDTVNPQGPLGGVEKVVRGGSWNGSILFSRSFHRNKSDPGLRYNDGGIRLVRNY